MTDAELNAGAAAVRKYADDSGYGSYIDDEKCRAMAAAVIEALEDARSSIMAPEKQGPE